MEGQVPGPVPTRLCVSPNSGPTQDLGILIQETKRKGKKVGPCIVRKALQVTLMSSQVWEPPVQERKMNLRVNADLGSNLSPSSC